MRAWGRGQRVRDSECQSGEEARLLNSKDVKGGILYDHESTDGRD